MITTAQLAGLRLHRRPPGQVAVAALMRFDYSFPRRTDIVLEQVAHLPSGRTVFLAMNHTDKYNYWPLQYAMYRRGLPFTATWVKGKYYDHPVTARFLDATNNIPLPSRGYLISTEFREAIGRRPEAPEYRFLRDLVDGAIEPDRADLASAGGDVRRFVGGDGPRAFVDGFEARFQPMIDQVIRLNRQAISELGVNVLVFPQGTRSLRLSRGHTGLVQMAWHLGAAIVPIGCNGSDRLYPTNSPLSKGGRVVYRFGAPIEPTGPEFRELQVTQPYVPLTRAAAEAHGDRFRAATDVVMARINDLLDPPYQFAPGGQSDGVRGMDRFL